MNTTMIAKRNEEKKEFINDLYDVATYNSINYWGDMVKNDDGTYTVSEVYFDDPEDNISRIFTHEDLFDVAYEYATYIIEENYNYGNIANHFFKWAKNVVALDLHEASFDMDADIADNLIQLAMFGKQKYA